MVNQLLQLLLQLLQLQGTLAVRVLVWRLMSRLQLYAVGKSSVWRKLLWQICRKNVWEFLQDGLDGLWNISWRSGGRVQWLQQNHE
jgi:hypothetical protein